ncbi:hypothetical protein F1880_007656 [Penicillium rolfsii]|nr:hypothetical protein F1880_007656 [Penicillium rolfsii]
MSNTNSPATEHAEPNLDTMTWVEVTQHTEKIIERFENEETTFQRWEVKVVWEYWRGFEMMGLNPGLTVLKFMRDVVIPFASSRVHSRLQGHTRYEKATGADKSKTYKIETTVDEGPAIVYRKGSSPETATAKSVGQAHDVLTVASSSRSAAGEGSASSPLHDKYHIHWDLGAHMRANTGTTTSSPPPHSEHVEDATQSSSTDSTTAILGQNTHFPPSDPAPFHNVPIAQAAENILKSPVSNSKLVSQGPSTGNGFPGAVTSRVAGHPELVKIVCNGKEEIVSTGDLVANNYLLRSTVESLNATVTSMQAIIEAQKDRIDALSGYIASQHAKIRGLTDNVTSLLDQASLSEKANK